MDKINNVPKFGGSGIEMCVFKYIQTVIAEGSSVLEFGGGAASTPSLGSKYLLYTVEQDEEWMIFPNLTTYIHSPILNGWYDSDIVKKNIPESVDLILIDGPKGEELRSGILKHDDILRRSKNIIVHDTWRELDRNLAITISKNLRMSIKFFEDEDSYAHIH